MGGIKWIKISAPSEDAGTDPMLIVLLRKNKSSDVSHGIQILHYALAWHTYHETFTDGKYMQIYIQIVEYSNMIIW